MQRDFRQENEEGALFSMPIALCFSTPDSKFTCRALLMHLLNPGEGLYCRIGVASWSFTETDQDERERGPSPGRCGSRSHVSLIHCAGYRDGLYSIEIA